VTTLAAGNLDAYTQTLASTGRSAEVGMSRVLLVVPPFYFLDRPSLGVSLLKAGLSQRGIQSDVLYLNLQFADFAGLELYTAVTEARYMAVVGEWLFAGDLFGERARDPMPYVDQVLVGRYADRAIAEQLLALRERVPAFLESIASEVDWSQYGLVGVTSTFQQNCAGLALLQRIKRSFPGTATVIGGANCEGAMGAAMHELFPFVDYVCSGEGDRIFPRLVAAILAGRPAGGLPGIYARDQLNLLGESNRAPAVTNLDSLPYPDYDDYFEQLAASTVGQKLAPILLFETARGCWWGEKHHCTFCGLNGEGMAYRSKSGQRAREEVDALVSRYDNTMVHVVDNILDFRYFASFLEELAERTFPPHFYYMTKANLTKDQVRLLARAGDRDITPGIESLSTPILRLMDKGVTALQNVRLLKWCAEVGIAPNWAILYGFPGEDPAEYDSMAELIPSLVHLPPPGGTNRIRLDRFSPNFDQAEARGFVNVRPAEAYRHIYPFPEHDLARLVWHFDYDYADGRDPEAYTSAFRAAIDRWRLDYHNAQLELRDDGERLEIFDSRPCALRERTVIEGVARLAYLALDAGQTATAVLAELQRSGGPKAPRLEQVEAWLDAWLAARLLMREGPRYVSLATSFGERVRLPAERIAAVLLKSSAAEKEQADSSPAAWYGPSGQGGGRRSAGL
jgi:ribosomal peptide maturation radical SAM protein 1